MLHWADYIIFVAFLAASIGIGLFHALSGGRQRTTAEFIMADRKLQVLPTSLSMLMSYQSAIMILGGTAEVYTGGVQTWLWAMLSCTLAILIVQGIFVPWFYPWKLTSVYKFFELRFGTREVRVYAAILGVLSNVMYMGTAMLAPSVALETGMLVSVGLVGVIPYAAGFPMEATIPIMALVCTIYTALGGMKAVIWTDVFQFGVMIAGMSAVLIRGYFLVDGYGAALDLLSTEGRVYWADTSPDPRVRHTVWGFVFGYTAMWTTIYGVSQPAVQRFCAVESVKKSRMMLLLNIPCLWVMMSMTYLTGITVISHYITKRCDPLTSGELRQSNEFLPLFVKQQFKNNPGFLGLFLATLYSGALSSVSSSLSGSAANAWDDIIKPGIRPVSEYTGALINKLLVIVFGFLAIGVSFMAAMLSGPITQISLAIGSSVMSPLFGMFLVSGIRAFSFCKSKGVLLGGIIGFLVCSWFSIGAALLKNKKPPLPHLSVANCTPALNLTEPEYPPLTGVDSLYEVSYIWNVFFGTIITMTSAVVISAILRLFDKDEPSESIPDSIFMKLYAQPTQYLSVAKNGSDAKEAQIMSLHHDEKISTI